METRTLLDTFGQLELANANEAETRLKLIDSILFSLLEWTHEDVKVEEHQSEDGKHFFTDYILGTASTKLVIEAKRVGKALFNLPHNRKVRIGSLKTYSIYQYIKQARDYSRANGIQFAAITNGGEWFIFPAVRIDGVSFENSSGICFPSIQSALRDDFGEFSTLLSRPSVIDGSLGLHLLGRKEDQFQERRLRFFFSNRGPTFIQNPLYPFLEKDIDSAFSDAIITSDAGLLERCYVKNADRTKYDNQIGMQLKRLEPPTRGSIKRPLQKSTHSDTGKQALEELKESSRPLAILVLGPVGVGKTTFLHYTRLVSASHQFEKRDDSPFYSPRIQPRSATPLNG